MDCLFCRICAREIPANILYEDDQILAFYDIEPKAPVHFLMIPKTHIDGASALNASNADVIAHIFVKIAELAAQLGLSSYRVVTNCGADAGQSVFHLHFHVLAGGKLGEMA